MTTGWRLGLTRRTLIRDTVDISMKYEIDRASANTPLRRPPVLLYLSLDDEFFLFPNQVYPNSLSVTAINPVHRNADLTQELKIKLSPFS